MIKIILCLIFAIPGIVFLFIGVAMFIYMLRFAEPLSCPLICFGSYECFRYAKICFKSIYEILTENPTPDVRWPVYWVNYDKEE
ncbi:hypothetical protein [Phascolarctobacterium faecium]|uniref:hypothetical protein n=1 Tax=Phascolarctobacterium faecium TaxID=33025 RepID=UPI002FDEE980